MDEEMMARAEGERKLWPRKQLQNHGGVADFMQQ